MGSREEKKDPIGALNFFWRIGTLYEECDGGRASTHIVWYFAIAQRE